MIPFSLSFAIEATGGTFHGDPRLLSSTVSGVTIDSRTAAEGFLYVPVLGKLHDGHLFIRSAFENGALCTLSDRELADTDLPYILVKDTTEALQLLAESYLSLNRIPVIGITGSSGKTSTKEMLYTVLSQSFNAYRTPGNLNNQTGVPQAVFQIESTHDLAILELGTNHPGEIRSLSKIIRPDICLITNIGVAHIEFFGSRENIFRGKMEIAEYMQPDGRIIVNGDDDYLGTVPGAVSFGLGESNCFRAAHVQDHGLFGSEFDILHPDGSFHVTVPAPGEHMVYNALAAAASGILLGMDETAITKGIASYKPFPGRMEVIRTDDLVILNDTYNANPSSMKTSIDVLSRSDGRHVCILGDMFELGESSPVFHKEIGEYAASHGIDLLLCAGKDAASIHAGADGNSGCRSFYFSSVEELLDALPSLLQKEDVVLVKASRGMHFEAITDYLLSGVFHL